MICPACQHPHDDQARFCDQCGQPLELRCPACESPARPGARFCSRCGHSLIQRAMPAPPSVVQAAAAPSPVALDEKQEQLQRSLPQHLPEKLLASRGQREGERKLVTVLFADIADYTALGERLGEEALFALMAEVYELFMHEVRRYDGTVNELTGDGIVAFFGAPFAVEQASQRAVHAALALQRAVARFNARLEEERGVCLQVRIGIDTGPVIVGTVGNNLCMDYKAVGDTVNLAACLEQTAAPGTIQITVHTYRQVAGYFQCDDLGLVSLKGKTSPIRVYRVTGERDVRSRLDAAREHGLTHLVGRERELALLRQSFEHARNGQGQAVSIVGDMGLGKSRLLYEFRQSLADVDHTFLEGRCSPYGAAVAYFPSSTSCNNIFVLNRTPARQILPITSAAVLRLLVSMRRRLPPFCFICWRRRSRVACWLLCRRRRSSTSCSKPCSPRAQGGRKIPASLRHRGLALDG